MNLLNQAISTYSSWEFNSVACFNGVYLGATDTGIYPLGGGKDNGADIDSFIETGSMDFGDTLIKYLRSAWITHRTDGVLKLKVWINEDMATLVHKFTTIIDTKMREERLKIPRGLKGRFYTIRLENVGGADFDIDSISLLIEPHSMRVR